MGNYNDNNDIIDIIKFSLIGKDISKWKKYYGKFF